MNYREKLRDERWQEVRRRILKRDLFQCQFCFQYAKDGLVLNVHHLHYLPNYEPWEYEEEMLLTLCIYCHEANHKWDRVRKRTIRERGDKRQAGDDIPF